MARSKLPVRICSKTSPHGPSAFAVPAGADCTDWLARVGYLSTTEDEAHACVRVLEIEVDPKHRRRGIGTRLYEHAARAACEHAGKPLCSDNIRSRQAGGFWKKQLLKGRATALPDHKSGSRRTVYRLTCPAPESLEGARRKR